LLGYKGNRTVTYETDWQFDVIVVYLDIKSMEAKINHMEDIII
jgi:hypothetical protein